MKKAMPTPSKDNDVFRQLVARACWVMTSERNIISVSPATVSGPITDFEKGLV